jgi:hypothetical protein
MSRSSGSRGGGIAGVISMVILSFVLLMFVIGFVPTIQTAIEGFTTTLPVVAAIVNIAAWLIPVGAVIAAIMLVVRYMGYGHKG